MIYYALILTYDRYHLTIKSTTRSLGVLTATYSKTHLFNSQLHTPFKKFAALSNFEIDVIATHLEFIRNLTST